MGGEFTTKMQEMINTADPSVVPKYSEELKATIASLDSFVELTDVPDEYAQVHATLKEDVKAFQTITYKYLDDLVKISNGELESNSSEVQADIKEFQDTTLKMADTMTEAKNIQDGQ